MKQPVIDGARTAKVLMLDPGVDLSMPAARDDALETLESGGVVVLRGTGFALTAREREMISNTRALLAGVDDRQVRDGRPTLIFDPSRGKIKRYHFAYLHGRIVRARVRRAVCPDLEAMMARFGMWAGDVLARLLPSYGSALVRDRITYRPNERSVVQPLHIDSSYGFPTQGRGMLRVFSNIDPAQRSRTWQVGEPFEPFANRFIPSLQPRSGGWVASVLARLGFIGGTKTPYDQLIAELRRVAKRDKEYQKTAPREIVEFPSGATWIAITDLVLHGGMSGQHSLDQTFFLPAVGMRDPSRSSLRILERLTHRQLV